MASSSFINPYAALLSQQITIIPSFTLESGVTLSHVPVAYKTWGRLNAKRDNCLIICHALTGSADVEDWWGPLLGIDRAFDPTRFFVFCANVIGSPYGTVSSVTVNPDTGRPYGPEMPGSTPKDDVRLHYLILQKLGVASIAAVVGGSMGGMNVLEYPLNTPPGFVRAVIPLATSARHSAWCISWGEAQRQSIYSDPDYKDGYYFERPDRSIDMSNQPNRGLAAARMAALLTYRSRDSFESRFGRRAGIKGGSKVPRGGVRIMGGPETTNPAEPSEADLSRSPRMRAWREHNDGHRSKGEGVSRRGSDADLSKPAEGSANGVTAENGGTTTDHPTNGEAESRAVASKEPPTKIFSAQSYLRYQGDKFSGRFDANCYIHITRKLDTHDLSLPSAHQTCSPASLSSQLPLPPTTEENALLDLSLQSALRLLPPALVIGIESDGLFTTSEQREIAAYIPDAELVLIPSPDGHDGFLLEFEAIDEWVQGWMRRKMPEYFGEAGRVMSPDEYRAQREGQDGSRGERESVFGEVEADVTRW